MASCPICQKPTQPSHRPFCSERCRQVDLGHWLKGTYAIPTESSENTPETPGEGDDDL